MLYRELLQERLKEPHMSLRKLARALDTYPSHIRRLVDMDTKPQGKTLEKLAHYFNRSERDLLSVNEVTEELIAIIKTMSLSEQQALLDMLKRSQFLRERKHP